MEIKLMTMSSRLVNHPRCVTPLENRQPFGERKKIKGQQYDGERLHENCEEYR